MKTHWIGILLLPLLATLARAENRAKFELEDGDRVVLLGGGFIERDGAYGYLEAAMSAQWPGRQVTYRNLGWSGDTVFGTARSYFGPPQEGFDRLRAHLELVKPTVVVAAYGSVASFEGEGGLDSFAAGYSRLIGMIREASPGARLVLLSPPPFESKPAPLPDMTERNRVLGIYRDRIRAIAEEDGCFFADAFGEIGDAGGLTDDGVHYSPKGYAAIAGKTLAAFGWDSRPVPTDQMEKLRELIVEKNRLFFYRWRPQNETYLHGFRKHEQGNNAKEVPQFDPLVEAKDAEIASLLAKLPK
ncbi:MAG: SGNH/GDSL hydrolase family protein [Verrucomicrobiales bacterium]